MQSKEKPDCLSIVDPHRQDNNISAGTHDIQRIVNCFSKAHETLQRQLYNKLIHPGLSGSLLEDVIGGNFSAYDLQRQSLYTLHSEMLRKASAIPPPPAILPPTVVAPPPPPRDPGSAQSVDLSVPATRTSVSAAAPASRNTATSSGEIPTANSAVGARVSHRPGTGFDLATDQGSS